VRPSALPLASNTSLQHRVASLDSQPSDPGLQLSFWWNSDIDDIVWRPSFPSLLAFIHENIGQPVWHGNLLYPAPPASPKPCAQPCGLHPNLQPSSQQPSLLTGRHLTSAFFYLLMWQVTNYSTIAPSATFLMGGGGCGSWPH